MWGGVDVTGATIDNWPAMASLLDTGLTNRTRRNARGLDDGTLRILWHPTQARMRVGHAGWMYKLLVRLLVW